MYAQRSDEVMEALNDGCASFYAGSFLPRCSVSIQDNSKIDLVMWAKNGERTLASVLNRINHVIPKEAVYQKFVVDDHSTDSTASIVREYGWNFLCNEGCGISDAANTALKYVESEYFCSFEQDLLLSSSWWNSITPLILGKSGVAAASGLRFLPKNNFCSNIEPYTLTRQGKENIENFGKTLDNTIWKTSILCDLGGFPKLNFAGIDTYLHCLFAAKGYKWLVDYDVQSLHLHRGFLNEVRHNFFYGLSLPELYEKMAVFSDVGSDVTWHYFLKKSLLSPIASLKMAAKMRDSRLLFAYPVIRLAWALGYLKGRKLGVDFDC
jgi:glycosyltransferase involved in cell wall biosynthesis